MSKKVLILSGSPRIGGNSDLLCDEFMKGTLEAGATTESLFDLDIINFENDNVIRIPRKKSSELRIIAETPINKAKIIVYEFFIAV